MALNIVEITFTSKETFSRNDELSWSWTHGCLAIFHYKPCREFPTVVINRKLFYVFALLAIVLLSAGCSNTRKKPEPIEVFDTQISDDGTKVFVYRLEMPKKSETLNKGSRGNGKRGGRGDGTKGGRGSGRSSDREKPMARSEQSNNKMDSKLEGGLEKILTDNTYCRDGYYELDRHRTLSDISIRGECRDEATEEDRRKFPNDR